MNSKLASFLIGGACLLALANAGLYVTLSKRVDTTTIKESEAASVDERAGQAVREPDFYAAALASGGRPGYNLPARPFSREEAISAIQQRKQDVDPRVYVATLARKMAAEPRMPSVEQAKLATIDRTVAAMTERDAASPPIEATCRGRRCQMSGDFSDEVRANEWAQTYLLTAGRDLPPAASIVVTRDGSGSSPIRLHLFLF